jgi:hypothetical protein
VSNLKISLAMTPLADSFASWSSASLAAWLGETTAAEADAYALKVLLDVGPGFSKATFFSLLPSLSLFNGFIFGLSKDASVLIVDGFELILFCFTLLWSFLTLTLGLLVSCFICLDDRFDVVWLATLPSLLSCAFLTATGSLILLLWDTSTLFGL